MKDINVKFQAYYKKYTKSIIDSYSKYYILILILVLIGVLTIQIYFGIISKQPITELTAIANLIAIIIFGHRQIKFNNDQIGINKELKEISNKQLAMQSEQHKIFIDQTQQNNRLDEKVKSTIKVELKSYSHDGKITFYLVNNDNSKIDEIIYYEYLHDENNFRKYKLCDSNSLKNNFEFEVNINSTNNPLIFIFAIKLTKTGSYIFSKVKQAEPKYNTSVTATVVNDLIDNLDNYSSVEEFENTIKLTD